MSEETGNSSILDGNMDAVIAALPEVADLAALKAEETAGKNRAGVIKAIDAEAAKRAPAKPQQPAKIKVVRPHGFITDDGANRHWNQGQIVTDADEIALLIERKADIEEVAE